jgi:starvation-inducible outer membrane lipoprotein
MENASMKQALILAGALALAACHEVPQTAQKPFAADSQKLLHDENALAARTQKENEYVRMGDMPRQ